MFYLDASAAVAAITEETHSERIWLWLDKQATASILVSGWVATEVSSVLSIKVRIGSLTLAQRVAAMESWRQLCEASLGEVVVLPEAFETAARFCDRPDLGLRAGDALHLAIASAANLSLITLDTRMAEAALQLGIPVEAV